MDSQLHQIVQLLNNPIGSEDDLIHKIVIPFITGCCTSKMKSWIEIPAV